MTVLYVMCSSEVEVTGEACNHLYIRGYSPHSFCILNFRLMRMKLKLDYKLKLKKENKYLIKQRWMDGLID